MFDLQRFQSEHEKLKVGVLMGGTSSERDVSLKSGKAIADALAADGFQVLGIDLEEDKVPFEAKSCDVVFPALHGGFGEDGGIQELMNELDIVYVGSGSEASRAIMDKEATKRILKEASLPVPRGRVLRDAAETFPEGLRFPVVVKPNSGGSSVAMNLVRQQHEWGPALAAAFNEDPIVLVEELLRGPEVTVGLIDGVPLTPVEIQPPGEFYDYDAKYTYANGKTQYFCPPQNVPREWWGNLKDIARDAYYALGARDLLRVDLMFTEIGGDPVILEANSIPGFTATSLLPKAAAEAGITFTELCTHLVLTALQRR